jgi:hypothetical protein
VPALFHIELPLLSEFVVISLLLRRRGSFEIGSDVEDNNFGLQSPIIAFYDDDDDNVTM